MKQTRITIRQDRVVILHGRPSSRAWCPVCRATREMVAIDSSGVDPKTTAWAALATLHRLQAADGTPLICMNSLLGIANTKPASPRQTVAQKEKELP